MARRVLREQLQSKCGWFAQVWNKIALFGFCRKQRKKEGLKTLHVGNSFSESALVPLVHLSSEQRNITVRMKLALQDSMPVKTVYPYLPTTARKTGGLAVVMVSELDTCSEGAWVEPPHWCRKGKRGRERILKHKVSNLREFSGAAGYQKNDLLQNFFMGNWVDRS